MGKVVHMGVSAMTNNFLKSFLSYLKNCKLQKMEISFGYNSHEYLYTNQSYPFEEMLSTIYQLFQLSVHSKLNFGVELGKQIYPDDDTCDEYKPHTQNPKNLISLVLDSVPGTYNHIHVRLFVPPNQVLLRTSLCKFLLQNASNEIKLKQRATEIVSNFMN